MQSDAGTAAYNCRQRRWSMRRAFVDLRGAPKSAKKACLALIALLCACTDGATRIAYEIESGVAAFRRSDGKTISIRHVPEARPDGCAGAYTVQFTASSALVIWCKKPDGSGVQSSH